MSCSLVTGVQTWALPICAAPEHACDTRPSCRAQRCPSHDSVATTSRPSKPQPRTDGPSHGSCRLPQPPIQHVHEGHSNRVGSCMPASSPSMQVESQIKARVNPNTIHTNDEPL